MEIASSSRPAVVALGGSAGALQSFFDFFDALSAEDVRADTAFVVVLHLSPGEESHLAELIGKRTTLPVVEVGTATAIEAGTVYVLPPDRTLDVAKGELLPLQRATGSAHRPVDDIIRALAREFRERTTAIIFSGTGWNGSAALGEVREAGGCVIAQTPETAAFDDMPKHAIDTGFVDLVLDPARMPSALVRNGVRLNDAEAAEQTAPAGGPDQADNESAAAPGGSERRRTCCRTRPSCGRTSSSAAT